MYLTSKVTSVGNNSAFSLVCMVCCEGWQQCFEKGICHAGLSVPHQPALTPSDGFLSEHIAFYFGYLVNAASVTVPKKPFPRINYHLCRSSIDPFLCSVCPFKCCHCSEERKIKKSTVSYSCSSFSVHKQFSIQALLPLKFPLWIFMRHHKCAECKYKSTVQSAKVNEDSLLVSCWVCCWMHCSNAWRLCSQGSPSKVRQGMHHMWTEKWRMLVSSQTRLKKEL